MLWFRLGSFPQRDEWGDCGALMQLLSSKIEFDKLHLFCDHHYTPRHSHHGRPEAYSQVRDYEKNHLLPR